MLMTFQGEEGSRDSIEGHTVGRWRKYKTKNNENQKTFEDEQQ